jgi:hypothetical protein
MGKKIVKIYSFNDNKAQRNLAVFLNDENADRNNLYFNEIIIYEV